MKSAVGLVAVATLCVTGGCQTGANARSDTPLAESATYLTLDELATAIADERGVTLIEFCVTTGCIRCDKMRGPIDGLARDRHDTLTVHRVDLRQHPQLAWEFKLTACPSYVAFRDGEEVFRAAHPTSAGLIASGLDAALERTSVDQLTLAAQ